MRLRPQAERDEQVTELVETVSFVDRETGELYAPEEPPEVVDPVGDADAE